MNTREDEKDTNTHRSFRGYTTFGRTNGGGSKLVEVVSLAPDTPPSPPVGSEVERRNHPDRTWEVLTPPYKGYGNKWYIQVSQGTMAGTVSASLLGCTWPGNPETKTFTIKLTGSDADAEHLKKVMAEHKLTVEVTEVDG